MFVVWDSYRGIAVCITTAEQSARREAKILNTIYQTDNYIVVVEGV